MDSATQRQLDDFLRQQQGKAYKMTYALTQNRDDALEIVQDAMLQLVQKYAGKPAADWPLLFYRILQNRIRDFHRKQNFRQLFGLFKANDEDSAQEAIERASDPYQPSPEQHVQNAGFHQHILQALKTLPLRQQQVFLLRAWQEFDTRETAYALGISPGSVKTHYSRALASMRTQLGEPDENT
jgi:RNA polymerase sigma-70 factor (ECF subfamily)